MADGGAPRPQSIISRYLQHVDWLSIGPTGKFRVDELQDELAAEQRRKRESESPYLSQEFVATLNTGRALPPEKWRELNDRDAMVKRQSDAIAAMLEARGIPVFGKSNVTAVGIVTGQAELLNQYRSICFLPAVAQRERRPALQELRYFRSQHPQHRKFMRLAVVTNGERVPVGGNLRQRIRGLSRTISRAAKWARDEWEVDIVARCIEFTVDPTDRSVHPHANVLLTPLRRLSKSDWSKFLIEASDHFGGYWWRDNGRLEKADEAIKYCVKPNELEALIAGDAELAGDVLKWLFEQTFGLKMIQPMGSFQAWRRDALSELVYRCKDRFGDVVEFAATGSAPPDVSPAMLESARLVRRRSHKVVTVERSAAAGPSLELCTVRRRGPRAFAGSRDATAVQPTEPRENVMLGITMPQRRFSPYSEPCALVMNYTRDPQSRFGSGALLEIEAARAKVIEVWRMNGAPEPDVALAVGRGQAAAAAGEAGKVRPFSVHTRSSTVRVRKQLQLFGRHSCVDPPADESHEPIRKAGNQ